MQLPQKGRPRKEIIRKLLAYRRMSHLDPSQVYRQLTSVYHLHGLTDLQRIVKDAFLIYEESNANFPHEEGTQKMEKEVVSMIGSLWGLNDAHGTMTAGGTESNLLALYTALNHAKGKRGSVIFPSSAHASFWKGCHYFGLKPVVVPIKDDFTADAEAMGKAVTDDTIAIVASCGSFPWATIDPIDELGEIAEKHSLYFHIDGSWGGLIVPFLEKLGYDIPKYGFDVKGVSSMNSDPHKQGFSIYPAGAIVFRDEELLKLSRWVATETGWTYSTSGLLGSRPGSTVAISWALFNYLGKEGYLKLSKKCMDLTMKFVERVREIPGLDVATIPKMNLANVMSRTINLDPVKKQLADKGWFFFETNGKPKTPENVIAVGLKPYNEKSLPLFLRDLEKVVSDVRRS